MTAEPTPTGRLLAIVAHRDDNVATLLADVPEGGATADLAAQDLKILGSIHCTGPIPFGHKVAIRTIARTAHVVKFGAVLGTATADIAVGQHAHTHNVASARLGAPASVGGSDARY